MTPLVIVVLSGLPTACPVAEYQDIEIYVVDTWQVPYVTEIQDISYNWDTGQMVLRSNADGKLFLADPWGCAYEGGIALPEGASTGFGVAWDPSNTHEYYINNGQAPLLILHSDGSDSWSSFPNPDPTGGSAMDFDTWFGGGMSDILFQASAAPPWQLYGMETDGSGSSATALPAVTGVIGGILAHEIATLSYDEFPALIVTTRYDHQFHFFWRSGDVYVQYGLEPCPVPVLESLGLTMSGSHVYWAFKGTDGGYYLSALEIPVFGGVADETSASVPGPRVLSVLENPCRNGAELLVTLPEPEQVTLDIYDLSGRLVSRVCAEPLPPGGNLFGFTGTAGVYTAVLRLPDRSESVRFVLVR
ncbi:MAG: T9SS type A sorting domain-containing protein [Candidatus Fermentibacteraceae bacterium]